MSFVETLLKRIEQERDATAHAAMRAPQGRDAFEYGRMCGLYAGIERARELLVEMISEADDADDRL